MAGQGINAVRVDLVTDRNVHVLAEMFEVRLFQEIGLSFAPPEKAASMVEEIVARIDSAMQVGPSDSIQAFLGFGYWNDTADERMCEVLEELVQAAKAFRPDLQSYYVTPFIDADRCSGIVDFVLLDAVSSDRPDQLLAGWRAVQSTPAGLASLGSTVRRGTREGYRVTNSEQAQARGLESALSNLSRLEIPPPAIFIDRWQERRPERLGELHIDGDRGLLSPTGTHRPVVSVVKGFFTGEQTVFAFEAGSPVSRDYSWINLLAFITATLFGFAYYSSVGLRALLRRYFLSHSFYLEKVADRRDTAVGLTFFLLAVLSVVASLVGLTIVTMVQPTNFWYVLVSKTPDWISWSLRAGARYPFLLLTGLATVFMTVALVWALILSSLTRGSSKLGVGQTLLLTVMPRWPVATVGLLALVLLNSEVQAPILAASILSGLWVILVIVYTSRALSDYLRLLGISALLTVPVVLLALLLLVATGWLVVGTQDLLPEVRMLWSVAIRT
jgi:hypothetical protein